MTTETQPETSVLELLKEGLCSPPCLLSQETGRCTCRCQGIHHGALLSSLTGPVPDAAPAADEAD